MMNTKTGATAALAALLLGGAGLAACGGSSHQAVTTAAVTQGARCQTGMPTVTINGYGTAEGTPNQAIISLGVQTQAKSAQAAMQANATKSDALVSILEADGVAPADLQTSGLSVQPDYNSAGTVILSYQVTNSVTVTLDDLANAGQVIDDAARVAGNSVLVNGITFTVKNEDALLGQARAAAVEQAVGQARVMASAAGMTLGPLCSLVDNTSESTPPPIFTSTGASVPSAAKTPIEPGSEQVTANVTAVFQLDAGMVAAGTPTGA